MRSTSTPNTNWTAQRGCELRVRTEGLDTFAVAVLLGLRRMRPLRPAATFTFFESVMPLVGLLLGRLVGARFETPAVVVGGIVLLGVAIYMFKEALEQEEEAEKLAFTT